MNEIEAIKRKWCLTSRKINAEQCVTCQNTATSCEASTPLYQFCGNGCQELFHGLWLQLGTKRLPDPDFVLPAGWNRFAEVQPELLVFILEFRYPDWQSKTKQFKELDLIRTIDENIREIIEERMYRLATRLPGDIEDILRNDMLQHFPNLTHLNLSFHELLDENEYLDLTHLSNLLEFLPPSKHNHFFLGTFPNLHKLVLGTVTREHIGPFLSSQLANMTQIKELYLTETDIIRDEDLVKFTNLKKLSPNEIITDSSVEKLTQLEYLYVFGNEITDAGIRPLVNLSQLRLESNDTIEESLLSLPNLTTLILLESSVGDDVLMQLTGLQHLKIRSNDGPGNAVLTLTNLKRLN
jgi:hypothetical protein